MAATVTIVRPTFIDNDTLDANAANGVWIVSATVPSATTGSEGVIQLTGDLAGTATAPVIALNAVTLAKFQQIATDKILGRATAGTGNTELLACTAAGRALMAAADAAAQRLLLMSAAGAAMATAADAAAQKVLLALGAVPNSDWTLNAPLKQVSETPQTPAISSGVVTVDLSLGTVFTVTLNANITSFTISNAPASRVSAFTLVLLQDGTGGRTVSFTFTGKTIHWPGSSAPVVTGTASRYDIFTFVTRDGGTNFDGFTAGQVYQ